MTMPDLRYLLITPAKNEATFIELTIQSVISQIVRPVRWIIIDDGSTDGSAEFLRKLESQGPHQAQVFVKMCGPSSKKII